MTTTTTDTAPGIGSAPGTDTALGIRSGPGTGPAPGTDTAPGTGSGPRTGAADSRRAPPPGPGELLAHTTADVPEPLAPGVVVVLPGGFRMSSGPAPAPCETVRPGPAPTVPRDVRPADVERVRVPATGIVRLLTEVLAGRRPPDGVAAVTTPAVRRYLAAARIVHPARPSRGRPGPGGRVGAPGCGSPDGPAARRTPRVHVGLPRPDVAEVCATVTVSGRVRALALRLDRAPDDRWLATAVRLV